jgi:DMSO/TMAO reductase YedYZ molybdopterin-dependent catalytic subunit
MTNVTRRSLFAGGAVAAGAVAMEALAAAGRRFGLVPPDSGGVYGVGETLNYASHRAFGRHSLAREFPRSMIATKPFANETPPLTVAFERHQAAHFANWRVSMRGHIARPLRLSLGELRRMPVSSQITEVACEEGWSYVAEWTGTPLAAVLTAAGVRPSARYVVYYSSDPGWWDSIDIDEAMHPQTLLAWGMNGSDLPVPFGGPVRMRVPRQLGYKSVKYINRLLVTDSLEGISLGSGQYAWYAGI